MRADLHNHTNHSHDSWIPPRKIAEMAKAKGIDAIAVTDHNKTSAWKEVEKRARELGVLVIRGEEVRIKRHGRNQGEVLGLFLQDEVRGPRETAAEIVDDIRAQGGLAVVPHPLDRFRGFKDREELQSILPKIHAIEGFNPRVFFPEENRLARELALKNKIPMTTGSDAHVSWEVGTCWVESRASDLEEFRKELLDVRTSLHTRYHPKLYRFLPSLAKLKNRLLKKR